MATAVIVFTSILLARNADANAPRTIKEIPRAPELLAPIIYPWFYRSLLLSPIEGWIIVRGFVVADHVTSLRVIRSDLNEEYDSLALELARNLQLQSSALLGSQIAYRPVLVHLLIYRLIDGDMAVSYAHLDDSGGINLKYYGAAWLAVKKAGQDWVPIKPRWLTRHEERGPRAYTLKVVPAGPEKVSMPRAVGRPRLVPR